MASDEKEPCSICGGTGRIVISDLSAALCDCVRRRRLKNFLGPEIAMAPYLGKEGGALYKPLNGDLDKKPEIDRTTENLFIKVRWSEFLRHAQLALAGRYWRDDTFRYRIVTDERLLNVWLGNEHYAAKAKRKRDDADSYNSLKDLIEEYDLVIVRLGLLGYKNVAAPGVLKQSLMMREVALKPTWVIQTPTVDTLHSWDEDVRAYIEENYDVVDFLKQAKKAAPAAPSMQVEEEDSVPAPAPGTVEKLPELIASDSIDPEGHSRHGRHKPGRWRGRGNKGNGGGAGPLGGLDV